MKKPFYKRWRVWAGTFVVLIAIGALMPSEEVEPPKVASTVKEEAKPVAVTGPTQAELDAKAAANKEKADANMEEWKKKAAEKAANKTTSDPVISEPAKSERDAELRKIAEKYIEKYAGSEIAKIDVNENLGANDGSYLVLAHMSFPRVNSAKQSLKMVSMYSEDLAANLAKESDVSDVIVFWEVPRYLEGRNAAKFTYVRAGDGMRLADEMIAPELQ